MEISNNSSNKGYDFFSNTKCNFFPCHKFENENNKNFNCLFCYCPLYNYQNCGGNFKVLENGCKDCSECTIPHQRKNYDYIIEKLQEFRSNSNDINNIKYKL